ncbi:HXXEE domain-containing protein [Nonomuraea pusilla]|uniref:HXXEE domain-containing protein n=1 Tax=Nonomuraea pusilla TaxID=46177 RepID=A0A1H7N3H7_9ACTN|nr:HXXEE domain-containing protein [Nonomuraea pusilla]SEL17879.1 Protein of unknown function with HXXEE motif-containing protein [Nonomuraea pusilla]
MKTTGAKTRQTERAGQTPRTDRRRQDTPGLPTARPQQARQPGVAGVAGLMRSARIGVTAGLALTATRGETAAGLPKTSGPAETAGLGREMEGRVSSAVTWGLLAAWAVHDAEELATMAGWARRARPRLERLFPQVPWQRLEVSQRQVTTAIALMGGVMAGASALGARTGGRSPVFQAALAGFGAHGVVHLAQAAVTRGYTPGVVTSPLVVIPFSLWAWRRLRESGVAVGAGGATAAGLAALPAVVAGVHVLAHALSGHTDARHGSQTPGKNRTDTQDADQPDGGSRHGDGWHGDAWQGDAWHGGQACGKDRRADVPRGDRPGREGRFGKVGGGVSRVRRFCRERWF